MKEQYFKEEDIMTLTPERKVKVKHSRELNNVNIILDFDKEDNIVGIDIYNFEDALDKSSEKLRKILR